MTTSPSASAIQDVRDWLSANKLKAIGIFWGTSVAGSLAWEWRKPIPPSLRIIHARVYAQAFTLAALSMAALESATRERGPPPPVDEAAYRPPAR